MKPLWINLHLLLCFALVCCYWTSCRSQSLSLCSVHLYDVSWQRATEECEKEKKDLLCYTYKEDIQDILESFSSLKSLGKTLKLWLYRRSCSQEAKQEEYLTLLVQKLDNNVWHYLQTSNKEDRLPFVCCKIETDDLTTEYPPKTYPSSSMTNQPTSISSTKQPSPVSSSSKVPISSSSKVPILSSSKVPISSSSKVPIVSSSKVPILSSSKVSILSSSKLPFSSSWLSTTLRSTSSLFLNSTLSSSTRTSVPNTKSSSDSSRLFSTKSTIISSTAKSHPHCKSVRRRGIWWPSTPVGKNVTVKCPGTSSGKATWFCSGPDGTWFPHTPNTTQCRSEALKNILEKFEETTAVATLDALHEFFGNESEFLQGNELVDSVRIMSLIVEKFHREISSVKKHLRWSVAENSVSKSVNIFDKMVEMETWSDVSDKVVIAAGSKMLSAVERCGFCLAEAMNNRDEHSISETNIVLQVLRKEPGSAVALPQNFHSLNYSIGGQVTLDKGYDKQLDRKGGPVTVVYAFFANMTSILISGRLGTLNTGVVSVSVAQENKPFSISGAVHILIQHFSSSDNDSACVFWNLQKNRWDPKGCKLKDSNSTHTLCECDHLTNFAVLTDFEGVLEEGDEAPLFIITVIGCSISIVSLAICIAVFTYNRLPRNNSWNIRYTIHRNLCITLLLANIILLAGLKQTENRVFCAVIAGFLHYFFLSAFSWMLLEGVHIYLLLVIVFASKKTHSGKYYLFGYVFPLLVVGITAAVRPKSYGNNDRCWLSVEDGAIWSFTGPVLCILIANSAALVLAQIKASRLSIKADNVAMIKRWLRVTLVLFPVLGTTWIFGFLYIGKNFKFMAYVFAILNSLQGFCIFVCHCLMDKNARSMVLARVYRRKATLETDSSRSKKTSTKDKPHVGLLGNSETSFLYKWQKKWNFLRRPWAFCFELKLSTGVQENPIEKRNEETPQVINWSKLNDIEPL